jgi:hypothetical protein
LDSLLFFLSCWAGSLVMNVKDHCRDGNGRARCELKSNHADPGGSQRSLETVAANSAEPNLEDPRIVLSLLEADQVVAAKRQTHFGPREFSFGVRLLLWGLRIYVILMLVIVLISVFRALQPPH